METIVFDLDGTLADTSQDLLAAANACFGALGHGDMLGVQDAATALQGGRAMLRLGFARLGISEEALVDAQYQPLLRFYAEAIDVHTRLYDGAIAAITTLRAQGYKTAICTNKPEGLATTLIARLGVAHLFDALVGADTLPQRKPHPAPYFEAVARAGGAVVRSFLVGDTVTDRDTARAAGVPIVLVTFGPAGGDMQALAPDALLAHFGQLESVTRQLLP